MYSRIKRVATKCWYKLRFGRRMEMKGFPQLEDTARIKLTDGVFRCGKGLVMKPNSYIAVVEGGQVTIGEDVSIARNTIMVCHDRISIGDHCAIAPNVVIYDHDHRFGINGIEAGFNTSPVVIEKNCWIAAGVTILRGTHIEEGCVIGAGCMIKGRIPAHSLVTQDSSLHIEPIESRDAGRGAAGC